MAHKDNLIRDMLKNITDPKLREQYGRLLSGDVVKVVKCLSDDIYEMQDVPILNKKGEPKLYTTGKKKGQPKTERKNVLVRKGCKGRIIANISSSGKVTETTPVEDVNGRYGKYSSGLEGHRVRLDGTLGFRCYCGNNSILLEEEKGIITAVPPSEQDLQTIALRLSKRTNIILPAHVRDQKEGFAVEDIKV